MAQTNNRSMFRGSPLYRVLQVLPTPVRPWLMAYDVISEARFQYNERKHGRRETSLIQQIAKEKSRRGTPIRTLLLGAGLAYAASKWLPAAAVEKPRMWVSGFMDDQLGTVKDQLEKVQTAVNDRFDQARTKIRTESDRLN